MFFHIGENAYLNEKDIIMILDLKSLKDSKENENFFKRVKDEYELVYHDGSYENNKTAIIVFENEKKKIHFTSISSSTLLKRVNKIDDLCVTSKK